MRQLYEQCIAYIHAFVDETPAYTPSDNYLARTAIAIGDVLVDVCAAIRDKTDPNIPVGQWSADQKALTDTVSPVISASANTIEALGRFR
ncbi:hypothetical protein, partial [Acinetobacter variabilis]|uniref:hypothetical protein n=1 Tax=Acinetobacter variabilis TaxID=70346 RepID=UPI0030FCABB2